MFVGFTINSESLRFGYSFLFYLYYFYVYPAVSDHGSSRISQLLLPILYIVLFVFCYNRNCLVGEILRKSSSDLLERTIISFFQCEFDTAWGTTGSQKRKKKIFSTPLHQMTIHLLYFHVNRGKKVLWTSDDLIQCCLAGY